MENERPEHPELKKLVTCMGRETVVELADLASTDQVWLQILIDATKKSKPKNRDRKAAWVLHHIFLRHPSLMEPRALELLDILDESDDASVYREILKIIVELKLTSSQLSAVRAPMLELGVGLLHDGVWSKGMHYIAMRLVERFAESAEDCILGVEAVGALKSRNTEKGDPICKVADKVITRLRLKVNALS